MLIKLNDQHKSTEKTMNKTKNNNTTRIKTPIVLKNKIKKLTMDF